MDLSYDQLEKFIHEISAGQKIVHVKNFKQKEVPLLFKYPTHRDRELAEFFYRLAYKEAQNEGLPTIEELSELTKQRKLFPLEDQEKLESLEAKLKGQQAVLAKTTRVPARRERLSKIVEDLEKQIVDLKHKRDGYLDNSCERKATEEKLLYLSWCCTYDPFEDRLFWETYKSFKDETDILFRRNAFTEYIIYYHGLGTKTMRYIARSTLWRVRYVAALKTGNDLFGCPIKDYTNDQLMLSYWSNYYQSIYEMLPDDRPPDSIIEDDAALDAYMKDWHADRNRESTASRSKNKKYGKPSAWDHNETLVMKSNEVYDDVEYSKTIREMGKDKGRKSADDAAFGRGKEGKRV